MNESLVQNAVDCAHKGEWACGNIFIRATRVNAGHVIEGHAHNFDHTTIVFTGAIRVRVTDADGVEQVQEFAAPTHFLVKKELEHEITALVDGTEYWCVYSHRTPQGDVVQEATGWKPAYAAVA